MKPIRAFLTLAAIISGLSASVYFSLPPAQTAPGVTPHPQADGVTCYTYLSELECEVVAQAIATDAPTATPQPSATAAPTTPSPTEPAPTATRTPTQTPAATATLTAAPPTLPAPTRTPQSIDINGGLENGTAFDTSGWTPFAVVGGPRYNLELAEAGASPNSRLEGAHSLRIAAEWECYDAGVYRTVSVQSDARLTFRAYARAWASSGGWGTPSDTGVYLRAYVGIDPTGGTTAGAASVVWAELPNAHDHWVGAEVRADARSTQATLFLRANVGWVGVADAGGPPCRWPLVNMMTFWDGGELTVR